MRLHHFADQVLGQVHAVHTHVHHRQQVIQTHGLDQIQCGTGFQELGGETGIRPEQQRRLTIDDAGIQMRNGHRRCADGRFAVHLGVMTLHSGFVLTHQPLAGYRETTVAFALGNAGFLQQRQRATAGTEEYETGVDDFAATAHAVFQSDRPATITALLQLVHFVAEQQFKGVTLLQ